MAKTKKYNVSVTFPLTLWLEIRAKDECEAIEKAKKKALKTPIEEWGDDFSQAEFDIVKE